MSASVFPSTLIGKGPSWQGFGQLKFLVIFGASYCDVGYNYRFSPVPTDDQPLGVEFPGTTFAEPGEANWVGHLITNYASSIPLLVYDYAWGGSRVPDVKTQIEVIFRQHIGEKPARAPWTATDTLFITWVGINDSAWSSENSENLKNLFEAHETLYNTGARNFLFANIPPIDRSPGVLSSFPRGTAENYVNWNTELKKAAALFATAHHDATVMIYSSWDTFNTLLDDPKAHGFSAEDVYRAGASIWVDALHPTSKVHDFVARDLSTFLLAQGAWSEIEHNQQI
ncbi:hypothetical protein GGX14DRAFT_373690 [Mycena pura]|uniref:Carbohydrate esterase family 16 protein n=1 Tax=Mycena pura TaxID=153505 RepID=A0AAD6V3H7_9AGAR|nr:hypothetical protein GGX14DRAFT_373690 [Mycena pura]